MEIIYRKRYYETTTSMLEFSYLSIKMNQRLVYKISNFKINVPLDGARCNSMSESATYLYC